MHFSWTDIILAVATTLGAWLGHRIASPSDHARAEMLDRIALGAAALVASLYPNADWATLLKMVVERIGDSAGIVSHTAIENAAAHALTTLGKNPATATP